MIVEGNIRKMNAKLTNPVNYFLPVGDSLISLNNLLGKQIQINYKHQINCIKCGRITKTSFAQGYCYPCFKTAPETEECVLKPELCRAHDGIARDMEYAKHNCLTDQYVYLSVTSGLKVGVTRSSQVPARFIDQGAVKAIKIAKTPNRYLAGIIEVKLKKNLADKTNWRNMLTGKYDENINLLQESENLKNLLPENLQKYLIVDEKITKINFPIIQNPHKVQSINLDKIDTIKGILTGIKGQYLIFYNGIVINIRKHNGYFIEFLY